MSEEKKTRIQDADLPMVMLLAVEISRDDERGEMSFADCFAVAAREWTRLLTICTKNGVQAPGGREGETGSRLCRDSEGFYLVPYTPKIPRAVAAQMHARMAQMADKDS